MNIAGIVIHSLPDQINAVESKLWAIPGVEVHGISEAGKLIITVEHDEHRAMADTISEVSSMEGVLSAAMVYQHSENIPGEQEATI